MSDRARKKIVKRIHQQKRLTRLVMEALKGYAHRPFYIHIPDPAPLDMLKIRIAPPWSTDLSAWPNLRPIYKIDAGC